MSNRTIFFLTAIVLVAMGVLLTLNLPDVLEGLPYEPYLKLPKIRNIEVVHKGKSYTLSFQQQKEMVSYINRSAAVDKIKEGEKSEPDFEKIVIYLFHDPDIELHPVVYVDEDLIYSAPMWNPNGYMLDLSDGEMKKLIRQAYNSTEKETDE